MVGMFVGPILCSEWSSDGETHTPLGRFETADPVVSSAELSSQECRVVNLILDNPGSLNHSQSHYLYYSITTIV